jgi:hypothetical protein
MLLQRQSKGAVRLEWILGQANPSAWNGSRLQQFEDVVHIR